MRISKALALGTALSTFPLYANADVTGPEVWSEFQEMMEISPNVELNIGSEEQNGDTLTVRNIVLLMNNSTKEENDYFKSSSDMTSVVNMEFISFRELGDGTVEVTYPPLVSMKTVGSSMKQYGDTPETENFEWDAEMRSTNYKMIAKGTVDDLDFDLTADALTMAVTRVVAEDIQLTGANELTLTKVTGSYAVQPEETYSAQQVLNAEDMALAVNLTSPDGPMAVTWNAKDFAFNFDGMFPSAMIAGGSEFKPEWLGGVAFDMVFSTGASTFDQKIVVDGSASDISGTSESSKLTASMKKEGGVRYTTDTRNFQMGGTFPDVPLPMDISIARAAMDFNIPYVKAEGPQDAGLEMRLEQVGVPAILWSMADPQNKLSHDPVTIVADLDLQVELDNDLFDEEALDAPAPPGKLLSAKLAELDIQAVGAAITGTGDVTFDNNDLETYDGIPAPIGSVSLQGAGINGLIDNLIGMGLIPEDQAMMGRMMLGMFTQSTGDDALQSVIEFKEGGQIFANGQRLK